MSKATEGSLGDLHGLLADTLAAEIRASLTRPLCDACGCKPGIPPALLAQAIKFLKDNGIDQPARAGNSVDRLASALPDMDELERASNITPFQRKKS